MDEPDQNDRSPGHLVQYGQRIFQPGSDRAVGKGAVRLAVAAIVESSKGAAGGSAMRLQRQRLSTRHIRPETATKHDLGDVSAGAVERDAGYTRLQKH